MHAEGHLTVSSFLIVASPQGYSDLLPGCDYGGRGALQYNGVICRWELLALYIYLEYQKFRSMNGHTVCEKSC